MLNSVSDRLGIAKANVRQKNKLNAMLRSAQKLLCDAQGRQTTLRHALAKEKSDVDALTGLNITGLFLTMLGSKEERLEKERQELVAAQLKFDQINETVEELKQDVRHLEDDLSGFGDADAEYERVLVEKENYLIENDQGAASQLLELTQQIADLTADRKELNEAAHAGQSALSSVKDIESTLASAANWGTLDMFGGGMLTTMAKHSKMDSAKSEARIAQRKLLQFEEELADADQRLQMSLEISGFSKFADFFFDGLIADWVVQSRINQAKEECSRVVARVKAALRQCKQRLASVESEISTRVEQKREMVESF